MLKSYKKVLAISISLFLLVSVLSACGAKEVKSSDQTTSSAATVQATTAPQSLPEVTLKFYFGGTSLTDTKTVWDAVAEKTKATLNAKFDINFVEFGQYADKLQLLAASGDKYDYAFDASWMAYPKMVNTGAYLDLAELAPKYMPNYYKILDDRGIINSIKVNGKLFCIPWTPVINDKPIIAWGEGEGGTKEMKAIGLDYPSNSIKTMEDLDKMLTEIKAKIPGKHYFENGGGQLTSTGGLLFAKYGYDYSFEFHTFAYKLDDPAMKMVPLEQTDMFKEVVKWNSKWVKDGIYPKDMLTNPDGHDAESQDLKVVQQFKGSADLESDRKAFPDGRRSELYPDAKWTLPSPLSNLSCINVNAANPERTLMFLDAISTDESLFDLVMYGEEGKHYVKKDGVYNYPEGMTAETSTYMGWAGGWGFWRDYFLKPSAGQPADFWTANKALLDSPKYIVSPAVGFFPDSEPIKNELAKRDSLYEELGKPLLFGITKDPDKALAEYIEKQKAAGLDKITAELQKQVDAYIATKQK